MLGKKILLGVSGGIAAYKMPLLVRLFVKAGAEVQVIMTARTKQFVTPDTLAVLSKRPVLTDVFGALEQPSHWAEHIRLGEWADMFLVAPATANTLAKLAHGFGDDMLSIVYLALRPNKPRLVFPAMDGEMFTAASVQRNIEQLVQDGCTVIPPEHGDLASGLVGVGRLPEPETIFAHAVKALAGSTDALDEDEQKYRGKHIVVTAGATREKIDPVRFISNYSSGKMGFALAEAAAQLGATVTLITGKTPLATPPTVARINIESAEEMLRAAESEFARADMFIAAAAVADYRPVEVQSEKLKKSDSEFSLRLIKNPDILAAFGAQKKPHQVAVGFALETHNGIENAKEKLLKKNLDMIVLNSANEAGAGFDVETNIITIITRDGFAEKFPLMHKRNAAKTILKKAAAFLSATAS